MVLTLKLFGILFLSFNLITIWKIYRADIDNKLWKYLLPIFLNFPTFFADKNLGFNWKLFSFYFLGSDIMIGYQNSYGIAAIPIGSLFIWWKIRGWEVSKEYDRIGK